MAKGKHRKNKKRNNGRIISILLVLFILLILVYNPISLRLTTIGVAIYYGLNPVVFYRVIKTESSFRSFAISDAQAIGLGRHRRLALPAPSASRAFHLAPRRQPRRDADDAPMAVADYRC